MFELLSPYNAQLLDGNALLVRAFGVTMPDGTIRRSKDYLLFGNGMATLIPWADRNLLGSPTQYVVTVTKRDDRRKQRGGRGSTYWEIQAVPDQSTKAEWTLWVSTSGIATEAVNDYRILVQQQGDPGQCFFLHR